MSDPIPAPWHIWQPHGPDFRIGRTYVMGATPRDERDLAPMVCSIDVDDPERVEATARLVAAAPDLLAACSRLVECDASELSEAYAQAYDAIDKAGGVVDG